jgi:hypothetical protein
MTKDFIEGGALVYAYSRPLMEAKISEKAMRTYEGTWKPTLTVLLVSQVAKS